MEWEHAVVAFNTAIDSANRMHDDEVARTFGFGGGLVPGVDVFAYLTRPCIDRSGIEFLAHGALRARFEQPVYDGERVTARLSPDGRLTLHGPDGAVRATGWASPDGSPAPPPLERGVRPAVVVAATPDALAPDTVLGTLDLVYQRELARRYLDDVRESSDLYDGGSVGHPGWLARQANGVLSRNVALGPWIHVETSAVHHGLVHDGDVVEVRGVVADERERRGHRFVELDVQILANERTVWTARHVAIWRPRVRATGSAGPSDRR